MKSFLIVFLVLSLSICFVGCNKQSSYISCDNCGKTLSTDTNFCGYCGSEVKNTDETIDADTTIKTEVDYSDFGYQNNKGLLEWIQIYDYNFSDKENAYVCVNSWYYVVSYENNYYEERYFSRFEKSDSAPLFDGDRNLGDLRDVFAYSVVNNKVINMNDTNSHTYEITEVNTNFGIPIIIVGECDSYRDYLYGVPEGMFIPTHFIDFEREIDIEYETTMGGNEFYKGYKYYIKPEYLK